LNYLNSGDQDINADETEANCTDGNGTRDVIVEQIAAWLTSSYDSECEHGTSEMHGCICEDDFDGRRCNVPMADYKHFVIISICATVGPTLIILLLGFLGWKMFIEVPGNSAGEKSELLSVSASAGRSSVQMSPLQLSASQGEPLLVSPASSFSAPPPRA
jgi:hypothetical protein